jgi:prevent-host-death family protein
MTMKTMTAVKAKTHFGELLDTAQREPVIITKKNRPVGVMFSMQDIEDTIWGEKARKAHEEGYLSASESEGILNKFRNA